MTQRPIPYISRCNPDGFEATLAKLDVASSRRSEPDASGKDKHEFRVAARQAERLLSLEDVWGHDIGGSE
jgi:hypothetical protein